MQHKRCSELQGALPARTTWSQATGQQTALRTRPLIQTPRPGRGLSCCFCPPVAVFLWVSLLLLALLVPGARCQLTEEQQETIVELHNYYRGQVSPRASAMMPLRWDSSLKVLAEGYAAKCIWNHNPELEETGENLYAATGTFDPGAALEKWFLENLDFDYDNNSCPEDKMCGHYTQMVWADTHRVGCALHLCDTMEGLDFERASFLVCNYYPAGNYEGERPYEEGDWCSRCPENLQKCQDNLCVSDDEDYTTESTETSHSWTSDPWLPPDTTTAPYQDPDDPSTTHQYAVDTTTEDQGHVDTTTEDQDHVDTTTDDQDHVDTTTEDQDHVDTTTEDQGHVDTTTEEQDHVDTTTEDQDHVDTTTDNQDHVDTTTEDQDHVDTTPNKQGPPSLPDPDTMHPDLGTETRTLPGTPTPTHTHIHTPTNRREETRRQQDEEMSNSSVVSSISPPVLFVLLLIIAQNMWL